MATSQPGNFAVLPQYQGDYLDVQRKQALAQALMGVAMNNGGNDLTAVGSHMRVMPKYSIGTGMTQLAQAYLAAKMGNDANQGMRDLGANQMNFLMGTPQQQDQPAPVAQSESAPGSFGVGSGGGFTDGGVDAGTSTLANALAQARAPQSSGGFLSPGGPNNPAGLPSQMAAQLYLTDPGKYWETQAKQFDPTDATKMARAGGFDVAQANRDALRKATYIAPTALKSPFYVDATGTVNSLPAAPEHGYMALQDPNSPTGWKYVQTPGGQEMVAGVSRAQAAGEGSVLPYSGVDAQGNPLPVTNRTAAATQGNSAPPTLSQMFAQQESSGGKTAPDNPMQIQKGTFEQYKQAGESWASPADRTAVANRVLANYEKKYGGDLGRIATAYFSGEGNVAPSGSPVPFLKNVSDSNGKSVASYVGDIYGRSGGGAQRGGSAIYAAPPMGAVNAANASQGAPSEQMKTAHAALSDADNVYQQSRDALTGMINIARKGATVTRFVPDGVATRLSNDAAEYGKLHANYVAMQGKALGAGGTDSSRATINESVPTYDKPQDAKVAGLTTQLNQLDMSHLKRQVMTPLYQQGNEKAYTQQSAKFDNIVKPSMMPTITPILQLSGDEQRAAVRKTVDANPSLRPVFEMLFNNGMLK